MSQHSHENPDSPEIEVGEIEERITKVRANNPPATLVDSDGKPVTPADAISESQVADLLGLKQNTLGLYRRDGKINPRLLLTNASPVALPPGQGRAVWWNRPLVEAIARSESTEPFYV